MRHFWRRATIRTTLGLASLAICAAATASTQTKGGAVAERLQDIGPHAVDAALAEDRGDALNELGLDYERGRNNRQQDHAIAARLYRASCQRGSAWGCANLGFMAPAPRSAIRSKWGHW